MFPPDATPPPAAADEEPLPTPAGPSSPIGPPARLYSSELNPAKPVVDDVGRFARSDADKEADPSSLSADGKLRLSAATLLPKPLKTAPTLSAAAPATPAAPAVPPKPANAPPLPPNRPSPPPPPPSPPPLTGNSSAPVAGVPPRPPPLTGPPVPSPPLPLPMPYLAPPPAHSHRHSQSPVPRRQHLTYPPPQCSALRPPTKQQWSTRSRTTRQKSPPQQ